MKRYRQSAEYLLTLPSFLWLVLFFLIPTLMIFAVAFKPADPLGGVGSGWTLETVLNWQNLNYPGVIYRTLCISLVTTAVSIFLAVPCAYAITRAKESMRRFLLMLVIVPFWTNFLIRVFAWKVLLHPEGFIKQTLVALHLIRPEASLLYTPFAVLLVMVYTSLPFAVLPIYAAAEKFDFRLIEAARDLGARSLQAFFTVFIPGISRGIVTAVLMVFIPALGAYVIPDLVGGPNSEMIGNKIAQRTFVDRNLPHAAWLSALLTLAVLAPMLVILFRKNGRRKEGSIFMEGV